MVTPYRFTDDAARIATCVTAAYTRQDAEGCVKVGEDLDRYRAVIERTRPDLIIETGTHTGSSAAWFSRFVRRVVTVDVNPLGATSSLPDNVTAVTGSSVAPKTLARVRRIARRHERVMVVLDSDHSAAHVTAEIDAYAPLVSPGCYLVVEDAIARWMPNETAYGTPYDAIESRLYDNAAWTHDEATRDMHTVTMYPDGWWVRNAR